MCVFGRFVGEVGVPVHQIFRQNHAGDRAAHLAQSRNSSAEAGGEPKRRFLLQAALFAECPEHRLGAVGAFQKKISRPFRFFLNRIR